MRGLWVASLTWAAIPSVCENAFILQKFSLFLFGHAFPSIPVFIYIIMYINCKWKNGREGVILETYFDNFSVEMIRVSIWVCVGVNVASVDEF